VLAACATRETLKKPQIEFLNVAASTDDAIDKAGVIVNAAITVKAHPEFKAARIQLDRAHELFNAFPSQVRDSSDTRLEHLQFMIEFEDGDLCQTQGKIEQALARRTDSVKRTGKPSNHLIFATTTKCFKRVEHSCWLIGASGTKLCPGST
jgi:hypothetical protein